MHLVENLFWRILSNNKKKQAAAKHNGMGESPKHDTE